jgi:hypothetical protein
LQRTRPKSATLGICSSTVGYIEGGAAAAGFGEFQGVLWTMTKRMTTQAAAMVKLRGATKRFIGRTFRW